MAVTRTGIPIGVWCWPGNTSDQELIRPAGMRQLPELQSADENEWTLLCGS
jgi:transposase